MICALGKQQHDYSTKINLRIMTSNNSKIKILSFLWRPLGKEILAGGFLRTQEIWERFSSSSEVIVVEPYPPLVQSNPSIKSKPFVYPSYLSKIDNISRKIERLLEVKTSIKNFWQMGKSILDKERIDVIYIPTSEIYWPVWSGYKLSKKYGVPLVLCNQNVHWTTKLTKPIHNLIMKAHREADLVITVSNHLKRLLEEKGVKTRIEVNTNGLDIKKYTPDTTKPKLFDAVFIGRHIPEKGIFQILEIWEKVSKERGAKIVMAGEIAGNMKHVLQKEIKRRGLEGLVSILGPVSERSKINLYQQSRFCLFPSTVEGWGLVPQEAMACGIPVIAYHLPAYNENIAKTKAANLIAINDVDAMAKAVQVFLKNPESINQLGEIGREFVKRFSWDKIAQREEELIRTAIAKRRIHKTLL